jgi:hypothetical protein
MLSLLDLRQGLGRTVMLSEVEVFPDKELELNAEFYFLGFSAMLERPRSKRANKSPYKNQ